MVSINKIDILFLFITIDQGESKKKKCKKGTDIPVSAMGRT